MIKGFEGDTYEVSTSILLTLLSPNSMLLKMKLIGIQCIDTQSELESCGGCMSGQYGLPGARPGQE